MQIHVELMRASGEEVLNSEKSVAFALDDTSEADFCTRVEVEAGSQYPDRFANAACRACQAGESVRKSLCLDLGTTSGRMPAKCRTEEVAMTTTALLPILACRADRPAADSLDMWPSSTASATWACSRAGGRC